MLKCRKTRTFIGHNVKLDQKLSNMHLLIHNNDVPIIMVMGKLHNQRTYYCESRHTSSSFQLFFHPISCNSPVTDIVREDTKPSAPALPLHNIDVLIL